MLDLVAIIDRSILNQTKSFLVLFWDLSWVRDTSICPPQSLMYLFTHRSWFLISHEDFTSQRHN